MKVAALDPFQGYNNAIDDTLQEAAAVLDAFHVVKLGTAAVDEVRRRGQLATFGHRGHKGEPALRHPADPALRGRAADREEEGPARRGLRRARCHFEVELVWACAQQLRSVYTVSDPAAGRRTAEHLLESFPSCPVPEIARLGGTWRRWRPAFLAYFDTSGASNRPTEAVNGVIETTRRIACGFRNFTNYRLRWLLSAGGN